MRNSFEFEFTEFEHKDGDLVMAEEVQNSRLFEILRRALSLVPRIQSLDFVIATESNLGLFLEYQCENVDAGERDFLNTGALLPSQYNIESKSMLKPLARLANVDQFTLNFRPHELSLEEFQCNMSDLSNHDVMVGIYHL